jgi:hypothetical protein
MAPRRMQSACPGPTLISSVNNPRRHSFAAVDLLLVMVMAVRWRGYDSRAAIEVRIRELREDFAFANIPTRAFAANNLYLDVIRFAYNLVTAFQRACLPDHWQSFTLRTLRHKLFLLPGALVRPHNRPVLRLHKTPRIENLVHHILSKIAKLPAVT